MHLAANRATASAGGAFRRQQPRLWPHFIEVLGDCQGIPDPNAVMREARNEDRGRRVAHAALHLQKRRDLGFSELTIAALLGHTLKLSAKRLMLGNLLYLYACADFAPCRIHRGKVFPLAGAKVADAPPSAGSPAAPPDPNSQRRDDSRSTKRDRRAIRNCGQRLW